MLCRFLQTSHNSFGNFINWEKKVVNLLASTTKCKDDDGKRRDSGSKECVTARLLCFVCPVPNDEAEKNSVFFFSPSENKITNNKVIQVKMNWQSYPEDISCKKTVLRQDRKESRCVFWKKKKQDRQKSVRIQLKSVTKKEEENQRRMLRMCGKSVQEKENQRSQHKIVWPTVYSRSGFHSSLRKKNREKNHIMCTMKQYK